MLISDQDEKFYHLCLLSDTVPLCQEYFCVAQWICNSLTPPQAVLHGAYTTLIPTEELRQKGLGIRMYIIPTVHSSFQELCCCAIYLTNLQRGTCHTTHVTQERGVVQDKATLTRGLVYEEVRKTTPSPELLGLVIVLGFAINASYLLCQDGRNHQNMLVTKHSGTSLAPSNSAKLGPFPSSWFQLP